MKHLLVLFVFVNFGLAQEAGWERGGGSNGDGANYVHPDQFVNMLVSGDFKCPGCSDKLGKPSSATYEQADFANQLNRNWIHHMEHKLNLWGYYINSPPPIIVDVWDQPNVQLKHGSDTSRQEKNAQSLMNDEMLTPRPEPLDSNLIKLDDIGHVYGGGLRPTLAQMNLALHIGETEAVVSNRWTEFEKIPKIEYKQDMIDARAATDDTELDVYFIYFHNEADEGNKHIKSYLECKEKYGHMANFYRTDTGFALLWAEKLDVYRVFNTIIAVHDQHNPYVMSNFYPDKGYPEIDEKITFLPHDYELYDEFVQLTQGGFMTFVRIHVDLMENGESQEGPFAKKFIKNA